MEQYHLVRLGMRVESAVKPPSAETCAMTLAAAPVVVYPITWYMYFAHGTPEAFLSLESSPVETRRRRSRYVILPYAHDSFYSM
ncbi:hypothetical protein V8C43DRAFT_228519 [Trichoderma afarasin]